MRPWSLPLHKMMPIGDSYESTEVALVEQQVHVKVFTIDHDALLPGQEGESAAQLHDEALHLSQDGCFEILLLVGVLEPEEVEQIGISQDQIGRDEIFVAEGSEFDSCQLGGFA